MISTSENISFQKPVVWLAKVVSYVLHPLFIPTYFYIFLAKTFRYEFVGFDESVLNLRVFSVFWMTAFFPAFAVFLLYKLKLIDSIFLRTQKERIIPFFITMFFYWWMYYLSKNMGNQPAVLKFFYFGVFISTSIGVVINNFMKISLHGMAMGGLLAAMILTSFYYSTNLGLPIAITTLLTGVVATSRFIAGEHTNREMYVGILVGIFCQLVGYWFVF